MCRTSCRQRQWNAAAWLRAQFRAEIRASCLASAGADRGNGADRPRPKYPSRLLIVNSGLATPTAAGRRRSQHDAFPSSCRRLRCPGVAVVQLCCLLRHATSPPFRTAQCLGDFAMIGEAARAVTEPGSSVHDTSSNRCGALSARWLWVLPHVSETAHQ